MPTSVQQTAYEKLLKFFQTNQGFGVNSDTQIQMADERIPNYYGIVVLPSGEIVDQRSPSTGGGWLNKVMQAAGGALPYVGAAMAGYGLLSGAGLIGSLGSETIGAAADAAGMTAEEFAAAVAAGGVEDLPAASISIMADAAGMTAEEFAAAAAAGGVEDISPAMLGAAGTTAAGGTAAAATPATESANVGSNLASTDVGAASASNSSLGTLGNAGGTTITAEQAATLGLSAADLVKLGITVLPVATAAVNALTGGNDAKTLSATTTSDTRPEYVKADAEKLWNDLIDDFYGTGGGTSVKDRETETAAYKSAADATYLADTKTAMAPYQKQLTDLLGQASSGTGYFTPLNLTTSKGGVTSPLVSFVPKQNKDTATQVLGMGKTSADTNALLAELANQLSLRNLPNAAADSYSSKLTDLMKYANTGGSTSTQTGTTPATSSWADILNAVNTAANIYGKFSGYTSSNDDLIKKLTTALSS